jgi:hypothetical protein
MSKPQDNRQDDLFRPALHKIIDLRDRSGQTQRNPTAPELSARAQAGNDHGRTLNPCPSVQASPSRAQVPAHPSWPGHS